MESNSILLENIVGNIVLIIGSIIAFSSVFFYRKTEKLKATLEMIYKITSSEFFKSGEEVLLFIKEDAGVIADDYINYKKSIKEKGKKVKPSKRVKIAIELKAYLNLFEGLCVGMNSKIYNEKSCKKALYSKFVNNWKKSESFIRVIRKMEKSPTLWQ